VISRKVSTGDRIFGLYNMKHPKNWRDLYGKKFNKLMVIKYAKSYKWQSYWLCKCVCGNLCEVSSAALISNNTKSCGCLKMEKLIKRSTKHNMVYTRFYHIYCGIVSRCKYKSKKDYRWYGGKGIRCLWLTFSDFKQDMYKSYLSHVKKFGEKETTIDRINSDGNYCKENCRWATLEEQKNNTTSNLFVYDENHNKQKVDDIYKICNINKPLIRSRIKRGWTYKEIITIPILKGSTTKQFFERARVYGNKGWEMKGFSFKKKK
jgi:hypothetical protein